MIERTDWDTSVRALETVLDTTGTPLRMFSLRAIDVDDAFTHDFVAPRPADVRSICKMVVSLVVGTLIERGVPVGDAPLTLDTRAVELFAQMPLLADVPGWQSWQDVRVRHLLSCSIGHEQGFLFRTDLGDRPLDSLLPYVFERPLAHAPGTHFAYSNVGTYVLSVILQELTGRRLADWASEILFDPLGITEHEWRRYGPHTAGCTGLALTPDGLQRLGELLRDNGSRDGLEIVPAAWCEQMRTPTIVTPGEYRAEDPLPRTAYGYGLWICGDGRYFCWGTGGQYVVVDPGRGRVITAQGDTPDMAPVAACLAPLIGA